MTVVEHVREPDLVGALTRGHADLPACSDGKG